MIKQFILHGIILWSGTLSLSAQSRDVLKMLAILRQEEKTWSSGDIEGYVDLYAPEDSTRMILNKGACIW
jgi:hypothetical protein